MPKSVEMSQGMPACFCGLFLFCVFPFPLHFLSFGFSFTPPNSLLCQLWSPEHLDLFLGLCTRPTALNSMETSDRMKTCAFLLRAEAAHPVSSFQWKPFWDRFLLVPTQRSHTTHKSRFPVLWWFLFFKGRRPLWLLVLSLYDDAPAFLACTFLFQSVLHLQLFLLLLQMLSGTQAALYPTHPPGTDECNSLADTPVIWATQILDLLSASWAYHLLGPSCLPKQTGHEMAQVPPGLGLESNMLCW